MEQQSSSNQQPFTTPQVLEQGQVVQISEKIQKVKVSKGNRCEIDGSDSEWSWDSIEDLKGVDLKNLQAEEENDGRMQPENKEKHKMKVVYPQKPTNIQQLTAKFVGNVLQRVGDLLIVQGDVKQTYQVVDLDGWVCDQNKNFIGFVIDVFGKVENPFYAIKPEQNIENLDQFTNQPIYYIEGTKILHEDQIKSIQSKNNKQFQVEESSSSDQSDNEDRELSVQPQTQKQHRNENFIQNRRHRKKSFDHGQRNNERSRTRQKFRANNWNRQTNEEYLQKMYTMHYNQMMQFYNPNYQANSMTIPPPPPQQFMNPPPFVPGNQVPMMPPQMPPQMQQQMPPQGQRQNVFMPPQNNYPPQQYPGNNNGYKR